MKQDQTEYSALQMWLDVQYVCTFLYTAQTNSSAYKKKKEMEHTVLRIILIFNQLWFDS